MTSSSSSEDDCWSMPLSFSCDDFVILRELSDSVRSMCGSFENPTVLVTSPNPSPVEQTMIRDRLVYIKRDDLLRLPGSIGGISGNKARKMYGIAILDDVEFPDCLVSHGGPQSNAMLSLAAIAAARNGRGDSKYPDVATPTDKGESDFPLPSAETERTSRFFYYTKRLPRYLRNQPSGNLLRATALGMELMELSPSEYSGIFGSQDGTSGRPPSCLVCPAPHRTLWVPQGGACSAALPGAIRLAVEVATFWDAESSGGNVDKMSELAVVVPSGTGTTALFLHRALQMNVTREAMGLTVEEFTKVESRIKIVAAPCVGDADYLRRQMSRLDIEAGTGNGTNIPEVLVPYPRFTKGSGDSIGEKRRSGYFAFGDPHPALLQTWKELQDEHDIFVDLLYGAPVWNNMFGHWINSMRNIGSKNKMLSPIDGRRVMYLHTGGLEGLSSQLTRYIHKGLLEKNTVQK